MNFISYCVGLIKLYNEFEGKTFSTNSCIPGVAAAGQSTRKNLKTGFFNLPLYDVKRLNVTIDKEERREG